MTAAEVRSWAAIRALDGDPLVTTEEVADVMRVSARTVSAWARQGRMAAIKTPGGIYRVRRSVVDAMFAPDVS